MNLRPPALAVALLAALLPGCGNKDAATALLVNVEVTSDNPAGCVRLLVHPASGEDLLSAPLERTKDTFKVAVYRSAETGPSVTLVARGYPSCQSSVANTEGLPLFAAFPESGSTEVTLSLPKRPVAADADADGHVATTAGGDDCNDNDASIYPGAEEACAETVDHDCDGLPGCQDPGCAGKGCRAGGTCADGACTGAQQELCDDHVDNDGNGDTDCLDEACLDQACSDGSACTQGETCVSDNGVRSCGLPASRTSCTQPPNPCFVGQGTCDPGDGGCTYVLKDPLAACDDGDPCTLEDTCLLDGGCGGSPVQCNGPTGSCFGPGACSPQTGQCEYPVLAGNACDDGQRCTLGDTCLSDGGCAPTGNVACDAGTCLATSCDPGTGLCSTPVAANNGGACDDGNGCTLSDTCSAGLCNGAPKSCADTNPCTDDFCDPADGGCSHPTDDTNTCLDGDACTGPNGVDRCFNGTCIRGEQKVCSDSNACTADSCNTLDGACVFTATTGTACSDGNGCTGPGGVDTCNNGICVPGTFKVCSDNNSCTDDACIPADGGCLFTADDTNTCTDESLCTTGDHCSAGTCVTTPVTCSDGNGCTSDGCSAATGCTFTVTVGAACSDGDGCTLGDQCISDGGCRSGTPKDCNDQVNCTLDSCDPSDGGCNNVPDHLFCDGGMPCEMYACDTIQDCVVTYKDAGTACTSDSDVCTTELCDGLGVCDLTNVVCADDGNACTAESCDPVTGCASISVPNDTPCTNGACRNGVCLPQLFFGTSTTETPSNFNATATAVQPNGTLTVSCTTAVFHTGTLDGLTPPSFTGCTADTSPAPTVQVITQLDGTTPATVMSVTALSLSLGGVLTVTGERPAIIAVYGDATVSGILDASADLGTPGPGGGVLTANNGSSLCSGTAGAASSGGAGGGGSGTGGNSGAGSLSSGTSPSGVTGGATRTISMLKPLVGGQAGGNGGALDAAKPAGGGGGGGLQLSVAGKLTVAGTIAAAGGGGGQGTNRNVPASTLDTCSADGTNYGAGGGGGGAGGNLLLEANRISLKSTGRVTANGGAGAEGANNNASGALGVNGSKTAWATTPAAAGAASKGGNGGNGGGASTLAATAALAASSGGGDYAGGGGGGGAAGYIRLNLLMATVSNANLCREANYVVSPSAAATTGGLNTAFSANVTFPSTATCN